MPTLGTPRAVLPNAFRVTRESVTPRYYGVMQDDEDALQVVVYSLSGEPLEDLAALAGFVGELPDICIVNDPLGNVGAPTLVWVDVADPGAELISTWDADADDLQTYAPTGLLAGGLRYIAGKLYWWEWPATFAGGTDPDVYLMSANADLSSVAVVATVALNISPPNDNTALTLSFAALNSAAAVAEFTASGGEDDSALTVRVTLAGADTQGAASMDMHGIADSAGTAIGHLFFPSPFAVRSIPDSLSAASAARWPTSAGWTLDSVLNLSTNAARTSALFFGSVDSAPHAIEAPSTATTGSPAFTTDISDHPTFGPPSRLFFMS